MLIVLVGALFLAGLSVSLVLRAALMPRMRAADTVQAIEGYGYAVRQGEANAGRGVRGAVDDVAGLLGAALGRRLGAVSEAELRNELMAAGLYTLPPRRFLGYRVLCVFMVPAAWLSVATTSGQSRFFLVVGLLVAVLA